MHREMKIGQEKAMKILRALIYQEMVDDTNEEFAGKKIIHHKPLIEEFVKFCGLSDQEHEELSDEVFENIDEFENNTFWENFAEKIAIVKREQEAEKRGIKFSQDEAFIKLSRYIDEINNKLDQVDQVGLWKYIAQYLK